MINLIKSDQTSSQLYSVKKFFGGLQAYLVFLHGGLRLASIKPVGINDLKPAGMIVPFCRWYYG